MQYVQEGVFFSCSISLSHDLYAILTGNHWQIIGIVALAMQMNEPLVLRS